MEFLILLGIVLYMGWQFYKHGKRIGSKKGYRVGRDRERRRL